MRSKLREPGPTTEKAVPLVSEAALKAKPFPVVNELALKTKPVPLTALEEAVMPEVPALRLRAVAPVAFPTVTTLALALVPMFTLPVAPESKVTALVVSERNERAPVPVILPLVVPVPPLATESAAPDQLLSLIEESVASEPSPKLVLAVSIFAKSERLLAGSSGVKPSASCLLLNVDQSTPARSPRLVADEFGILKEWTLSDEEIEK